MTTNSEASITHRITVDITFKETEHKTVTHPITFVILQNGSTSITLGKPILDWLGFRSNRQKIYFEKDDIRFNSIVATGSKEVATGSKDMATGSKDIT